MVKFFPIIALVLFFSFLVACSGTDENSGQVENFSFGECQRPTLEKSMVLSSVGDSELDIVDNEKIVSIIISEDKTHIHLDSVYRNCESSAKIRSSRIADTLKLENYFPDSDNYYQAKCICCSSMEVTLGRVEEGIKYIVYGRVYQAKYEERGSL